MEEPKGVARSYANPGDKGKGEASLRLIAKDPVEVIATPIWTAGVIPNLTKICPVAGGGVAIQQEHVVSIVRSGSTRERIFELDSPDERLLSVNGLGQVYAYSPTPPWLVRYGPDGVRVKASGPGLEEMKEVKTGCVQVWPSLSRDYVLIFRPEEQSFLLGSISHKGGEASIRPYSSPTGWQLMHAWVRGSQLCGHMCKESGGTDLAFFSTGIGSSLIVRKLKPHMEPIRDRPWGCALDHGRFLSVFRWDTRDCRGRIYTDIQRGCEASERDSYYLHSSGRLSLWSWVNLPVAKFYWCNDDLYSNDEFFGQLSEPTTWTSKKDQKVVRPSLVGILKFLAKLHQTASKDPACPSVSTETQQRTREVFETLQDARWPDEKAARQAILHTLLRAYHDETFTQLSVLVLQKSEIVPKALLPELLANASSPDELRLAAILCRLVWGQPEWPEALVDGIKRFLQIWGGKPENGQLLRGNATDPWEFLGCYVVPYEPSVEESSESGIDSVEGEESENSSTSNGDSSGNEDALELLRYVLPEDFSSNRPWWVRTRKDLLRATQYGQNPGRGSVAAELAIWLGSEGGDLFEPVRKEIDPWLEISRELDRDFFAPPGAVLNLEGCDLSEDAAAQLVSQVNGLYSLGLARFDGWGERQLQMLAENNPTLCHLDLSYQKGLEPDVIRSFLERCPGLRTLRLRQTMVRRQEFMLPGRAQRIRLMELDLSECASVYGGTVEVVARVFPNLTSLRLRDNAEISEVAVKAVGACSQLRFLDLTNCAQVPEGMRRALDYESIVEMGIVLDRQPSQALWPAPDLDIGIVELQEIDAQKLIENLAKVPKRGLREANPELFKRARLTYAFEGAVGGFLGGTFCGTPFVLVDWIVKDPWELGTELALWAIGGVVIGASYQLIWPTRAEAAVRGSDGYIDWCRDESHRLLRNFVSKRLPKDSILLTSEGDLPIHPGTEPGGKKSKELPGVWFIPFESSHSSFSHHRIRIREVLPGDNTIDRPDLEALSSLLVASVSAQLLVRDDLVPEVSTSAHWNLNEAYGRGLRAVRKLMKDDAGQASLERVQKLQRQVEAQLSSSGLAYVLDQSGSAQQKAAKLSLPSSVEYWLPKTPEWASDSAQRFPSV